MFLRIFKITLLFLAFSTPVFSQSSDEEKLRAEQEEKALETLNERIQEFLSGLDSDDFQKEIIKQKLNSYYQAKKAIFMDASLKYFERDEKLTSLDNTHFTDIKEVISDDAMEKIKVFIKDAGTTLKKQKKKEKKRKNKN